MGPDAIAGWGPDLGTLPREQESDGIHGKVLPVHPDKPDTSWKSSEPQGLKVQKLCATPAGLQHTVICQAIELGVFRRFRNLLTPRPSAPPHLPLVELKPQQRPSAGDGGAAPGPAPSSAMSGRRSEGDSSASRRRAGAASMHHLAVTSQCCD